jgi:histidine triad (HIT) family protein
MACVFCDIVAGTTPAHRVFVGFLDARPVFPGHVLVIPRRHLATLEDLPRELVAPLFGVVQRVARGVEAALAADGTFVALNNKVSQSVPHLHVHVVPRRKKDGLRGFFWPRNKYASDDDAARVGELIRGAIASA